MQNIIIENWYFKSFVDNKKEKKKAEIKSKSRGLWIVINTPLLAFACMHTHMSLTHHKLVSVQSLIRLAYAGKRCCPHVMCLSISVGNEDAIISTYVNDIMEYHSSLSRNHFFFFHFFTIYISCARLASVKIKPTDVTI